MVSTVFGQGSIMFTDNKISRKELMTKPTLDDKMPWQTIPLLSYLTLSVD